MPKYFVTVDYRDGAWIGVGHGKQIGPFRHRSAPGQAPDGSTWLQLIVAHSLPNERVASQMASELRDAFRAHDAYDLDLADMLAFLACFHERCLPEPGAANDI